MWTLATPVILTSLLFLFLVFRITQLLYETLDHISSSIVVMMHVVKGRQYSGYIVHASIEGMDWTNLRPTRPQ